MLLPGSWSWEQNQVLHPLDARQASRLAPPFQKVFRLPGKDQTNAAIRLNDLYKPVLFDLAGLDPYAAGRPEIQSEKACVPDCQMGEALFHGYSILGLGRCHYLDFLESSAT